MKSGAHLFSALLLCAAPSMLQAAVLSPTTAPDRTPDGYPIIWLGNGGVVENQPTPTSATDAVPASFKRIRTPDQYVRFVSGSDKRAYGCYAGTAPEVASTQLTEVHGREEGDGPKTTFHVNGWLISCKPLSASAPPADLSNVPAPPPPSAPQ